MDVYHAGVDCRGWWNGCVCIIALVWRVDAEDVASAIMGES